MCISYSEVTIIGGIHFVNNSAYEAGGAIMSVDSKPGWLLLGIKKQLSVNEIGRKQQSCSQHNNGALNSTETLIS